MSFFCCIRTKNSTRNIEGIWDTFVDSELEDSDGDDDLEFEFEEHKRIRVGNQILTLEDEQFIENCSEDEDFEGFSDTDIVMNVNMNNKEAQIGVDRQWSWTAKDDIKWCAGVIKKRSFEFEPVENDDTIEDYFTPSTYFMKYVPEPLFDDMVKYTNIYAEQQQTKKWRPTDKTEMKQFIGLQIMMGNLKLPRIEMYYGRELSSKMFTDTVPLYRFYLLRTNLHLIDITTMPTDCPDKFIRVRPLMDSVRKRCLQLPLEEYLSIDEKMIPMRGRVGKGIKQFVRNKPKIKWGVKNLVLCGKSGLAYDFVVYQGSTTEFDPEILCTFGSGATMVLHLANRIDRSGHKLFFDNYFSTFQLFEILAQKKIYAAGTIRIDRFAKPPFTKDSEMKKKGRGCSEEVVSANGSVTCVKWYDNKCVALASNYIGVGTLDKAQRFDKTSKQKISIDRPQVVQEYNINMGGVDLMNQMISYYRIFIRSKKWTLRMVTHFIDFSVIQSWIEYKMDCQKLGVRITLDDLRSKRVRGEKSRERRTDENIRYDGYQHVPDHSEKRMRCKFESSISDSLSKVQCSSLLEQKQQVFR